jgi:hypothetical protein
MASFSMRTFNYGVMVSNSVVFIPVCMVFLKEETKMSRLFVLHSKDDIRSFFYEICDIKFEKKTMEYIEELFKGLTHFPEVSENPMEKIVGNTADFFWEFSVVFFDNHKDGENPDDLDSEDTGGNNLLN